jgi:hypothetical protein
MKITPTELRDALDFPINDYDSGATSARDYFKKLLLTLWDEQEGFSGKRPFGNSGWDYDLGADLTRAGYKLPNGESLAVLDEHGWVESIHDDYDIFIDALIKAL